MRVYAVLAHDRQSSLCASFYRSLIKNFNGLGHEVDEINLYERASEISFFTRPDRDQKGQKKTVKDSPFFQENLQRFMAADRLVLVYPIYWYAPPGILKCWLDLITNFAWQFEGGFAARPLHKIKKTFTVHTSFEPVWYFKYLKGNIATKQLRQTFNWMGIKHNYFFEIGSAGSLTEEQIKKLAFRMIEKSNTLLW